MISEEIERYAAARSTPMPAAMEDLAAETARELGRAGMLSGPVVGRLLELLVALARPRLVVELGTFSGYSALAMAAALPPDGRIVTCEASERHAAFARERLAADALGDRIELREEPALETLATLDEPVDLAFVDADKERYLDYYEALVPRLSGHGLIVADNTLQGGGVIDAADERGRAMDAFNRHVLDDPRTRNVLLTVRDGVTLAWPAPPPPR